MKRVLIFLVIAIVLVFSHRETYAMQIIPPTNNPAITAFSFTTPEEFSVRYNQAVEACKGEDWMYVGEPTWETGECSVNNDPQFRYHVRIYMATDSEGYIKWITFTPPVHYSVCTDEHRIAMGKVIGCALHALMPNSTRIGIGANIMAHFTLNSGMTQRYDTNNLMAVKRLYADTILCIDILHLGPTEE